MKPFYIGFLLIVLIFSGCYSFGKKISNKGNIVKEIYCLRINFQEGDPSSLHPHLGVDLRSHAVETALYEGLVRVDADGTIIPTGAEKSAFLPRKRHTPFIYALCNGQMESK
jgi:ABC-type oligopeptide transport system substrate-binding subunit